MGCGASKARRPGKKKFFYFTFFLSFALTPCPPKLVALKYSLCGFYYFTKQTFSKRQS